MVKNLPAKAGDSGYMDLTPGSGICPEGGNGNPLQHFVWENSMERGAWWVTVHGRKESDTTKQLSMHMHI